MGKERERQAGQRKQNNTRRKNNNRASEKTPYLTIKRKQKNAGRESDRRNTDKKIKLNQQKQSSKSTERAALKTTISLLLCRKEENEKKINGSNLTGIMVGSSLIPATTVLAGDDVETLRVWVFGEGSTAECEAVSKA